VGEDITCPSQIAKNGRIRIRSERAAEVARWFGLDRRRATDIADAHGVDAKPASGTAAMLAIPKLSLRPGTITLIAGPSGAGKSTLLRAARDAHPNCRWIDLATIAAPDVPLVDCFGELPLRDARGLLARVGLGEAWTYLRTPAELSEGQRWRFRLAMALHDAARDENDSPVIACDEFAAVLDRVTAIVVAHRLRRAIDALPHAAAVVATSHEDIEVALAAEVVVRCDFGRVERETREKSEGRNQNDESNPNDE
jgi:ABC-type ATPase with predicted acetyltransferase domain